MFFRTLTKTSKFLPLAIAFSFSSEYFRNCNKYPIYALNYPSTKDRIRGEYENKIRMFSTPEKIFEIFATIKKDDELYMSYNDLFRAICPFNYSDSPDEKTKLTGEQSAIIKLIDVDKDGLISIYEYMILVSFLQISQNDISEFFKKLVEGSTITKENFQSFLYHLRDQTKIKLTSTGVLPDPRVVHISKEKYEEAIMKVIENVFKSEGKVTVDSILGLKQELLSEIYDYEFNSFPSQNENQINEEDFAKSIICFLDISKVSSHMKHLENFKFGNDLISKKNYCDFHQFFKDNYHELEKEVKESGILKKNKIKKMISNFCKKSGAHITDRQLDIFIYILDVNGDNRIDNKEFLGVIKNRSFYGAPESHSLDQPFISLQQFISRIFDKMVRIYEIIAE